MTITRPHLRHACLALVLGVGDAALALTYGNPIAWMLIALPAAGLVLGMHVPQRFARALTWISRALIAAVAIGGSAIEPVAGLALAALAGVFLLDETSFPPGRVALPSILSVLLAAAFERHAAQLAVCAWVVAAIMLVWLASGAEGAARPRRLVALALFVVPSVIAGQAMIRFLPWAQPRVERSVARFGSSGVRVGVGETSLGTDPALGGVQRLAVVKRPVLRIWSPAPIALRTAVYTRFNGRMWEVADDLHVSLPLMRTSEKIAASNVPGEWLIRPGVHPHDAGEVAKIVVAAQLASVLPAPSGVRAVRSIEPNMRIDAFDLVLAPSRVPAIYGFKHAKTVAPERDAKMVSACLTVPPQIDARMRMLAHELGPADADVNAKIRRTIADLRSRCRYALDAGRWKSDDRISEFLFDKKQGYCEYFATSAVLLLRLQGVPARYVTGFNVSNRNRRGAYYLVRTTDAYAWAEALVPAGGWVAVDAVPPGDFSAVQDAMAMSAGEEMIEPVRARWSEIVARWHEGGREHALALARSPLPWIVVAITAGVVLFKRRRAARPRIFAQPEPDTDPALRSCFEKLEEVWVRSSHPRPPCRAPMEHARALPDGNEALRTLSAEVVDSFYRTAYGGQPVAADETARLAAELDRVLQSLRH